jgi:CRP-like cAMP-binding protein
MPDEARTDLLKRCQRLSLPKRYVCYEAEEKPEFCYFLESGFASVVSTMKNGETAEVEMIGNEGIVGGSFLLANPCIPTPTRCFIQAAGQAQRIAASDMADIFHQHPEIRSTILSFFQKEIAAFGQIAGCHRIHDAEQRLVRWLLMAHDRVGDDALHLTQEFLAEMLGTRRTTVTEIAGSLQRRGMIEYSRGTVIITNRRALEEASCECYGVLRRIFGNFVG